MSECELCVIKSMNALKTLTPDQLKKISELKTSVKVKKGDNLLKEGNTVNGLFCVKDGKCKMTKLNSNGKDQIIKYSKGGDILGHRSLLSEEPAGLTVTALEDLRACYIPKEEILNTIRDNNNFSLHLMKNISHQLNEANSSISEMAQKPVKERLAITLLRLEEIFGVDKDGFIDVLLTREEIANTIGTATESAIRLISNFKKEQLIELKGKYIRILSKNKLRNISEGY